MQELPVEPKPLLQVKPQVLSVHVAVPSETAGQAVATAPQFCGSLVTSMHAAPVDPYPALQVNPQVPLEQVDVPLAMAEHALPTPPQF
jgi:hypothetical protein